MGKGVLQMPVAGAGWPGRGRGSLKPEQCEDDATSHLDIACGDALVLCYVTLCYRTRECPSDLRKFRPDRGITTYIGPEGEAGKRPTM
jgi:hypothetical protein